MRRWVQIISVTLYYRENGGNRFLDSFPIRVNSKHIDDCTADDSGEQQHHGTNSSEDSVSSNEGSLSPSLLIHTSRLREEIEEWSRKWRDLSLKKKNEEEWQQMKFKGHQLCIALERELEESYAPFTRNKQFIVRLQERPIYHLKLMNAYNVDWPIWTTDIGKKEYCRYLTTQLKERLSAWAINFNTNFNTCLLFQHQQNTDDDDNDGGGWEGWKTREQEQQHWKEGKDLEQQLQEQLEAGDSTVDWNVFLLES